MKVSINDWQAYISKLAAINEAAAAETQAYIDAYGTANMTELVNVAYSIASKYGEASSALACQMYDALALAQGATISPAEPTEATKYGDVAKAVYGIKKQDKVEQIPQAIERMVKRSADETVLKNAQRDGAQYAWIPSGDPCAFCITIASRGWQYLSKKSKKVRAEHIHANCKCTYSVRFNRTSTIEGYDPDKYLKMYYDAGSIEELRRQLDAKKS